MPYKSKKQMRWAHTKSGEKALGKAGVKEFDRASKGKKLPETANKSKHKKHSDDRVHERN